MPIGPPFQVPDPKSACIRTPVPIVFTSVAELVATGRWSIGVFHTLSAGNTGHPPTVGWAAAVSADNAISE
jgi:hypothetical protein